MGTDLNIGHVTAYAYAKSKGYTGTEEQFATELAQFAENAQQVAEDKEAVEQLVDEFLNTTAPAVIQGVTDEGTSQVERVAGAGTAQVTRVGEAGNTQIDAVAAAGTTQIGLVTAEGTAQVTRVQDKGDEVIDSIPADYTALTQEVSDLNQHIDEIKNTELLTAGDTAVFTWSTPGSVNSDVYLYAGTTYTLMSLDDPIGGSLFIEGHTAQSTYMHAKGEEWEFAPSNSGFLRFYSDDVTSGTVVRIKVVGEIDRKADVPIEYHVGSGYEYTTINACIIAMQSEAEDAQKIMYIHGGTYDLYTEMGGSNYIESISASDSWRNVNNIVPPNTKIIGIGSPILQMNLPDNVDSGKAVLVSALNFSGNFELENVNIECKNLRYAIHIEGSAIAKWNEQRYEISRCNIKRTAGTYNNSAIGIGMNLGSRLIINNCIFENESEASFLLHGNNSSGTTSPKVDIENSIFLSSLMSMNLISNNTTGVISINCANCYCNSVIYKANGRAPTRIDDNFNIRCLTCNDIQVSTSPTLDNVIAVTKYNTVT